MVHAVILELGAVQVPESWKFPAFRDLVLPARELNNIRVDRHRQRLGAAELAGQTQDDVIAAVRVRFGRC